LGHLVAWLDGQDAGVAAAELRDTAIAGQQARLEAGRGQQIEQVLARVQAQAVQLVAAPPAAAR
jgi:hypothetical protein